jgi:D-alanyl-D-alanine carboxypeptidase
LAQRFESLPFAARRHQQGGVGRAEGIFVRKRFVTSLVASLAIAAPNIAGAGPALLIDAQSGKVLYAEDQDNQWYPASLTKIMTAYVVFETLKAGKLALDSKLVTSEHAHSQPPSKVGLPIGGEMTVELGLQALIVKSANDVAVMLAEAVSGSEAAFVERMNATAKRLGMSRTRFANANGLPAPEQVTTARDLAKLSMAVLRDHPDRQHYWALPDMRIGRMRLRTHNVLLRNYEGADGLKTGFICDSGFNVVASANRGGRRLMAVVLGETSGLERATRASSLLEHGFNTYDWKTFFTAPNLDSLPVAAEAKSVVSMRDTVTSWECGGRRRARAVARAKLKQRANAVAAKQQSVPAAGSGSPAPAKAAAAPAAAATTAKPQPAAKAKAATAAPPAQ